MNDVTAFNNCMNVFWRQHEAELSRFLTSKTGDREKAADLLQELFLRARVHSDSFCEMENPRAWLYRAARNLLIDEYRNTREFVELEEEVHLPDVSPDAIWGRLRKRKIKHAKRAWRLAPSGTASEWTRR
ncbi:sigma factor, partial [Citrobacter freundii]|uniref:sigma factor n=1 Tax=Citrobacter freundii TaxID=546 RepID=UPI0039787EC6